jgi:hypothetical protein
MTTAQHQLRVLAVIQLPEVCPVLRVLCSCKGYVDLKPDDQISQETLPMLWHKIDHKRLGEK